MMKRLLWLLVLIASPVCAQQPPQDSSLAACQQLLANANSQTIATAAQATTLGQQLSAAQAELVKLRGEAKQEAPK